MDIGGVGAQRLDGMDALEQRVAAELADADMDRDRRADVARGAPGLEDHLRRAAGRGEEQRQQLIVGRKVLLAQPRDIVRVTMARRLRPVAGRVLRVAVGEHRAHARILQRLDRGVAVRGRVVDVRPVEHRGDARFDAAERRALVVKSRLSPGSQVA